MADTPPERPAGSPDAQASPGTRDPSAGRYRVLARAHRPQRLSELIGQEVLVRSLTNAVRTGRVAHAFLLTGIRGVGKTTTARIIARALNCIGEDGQGGPTPEPCGVCEHCRAIAEDRHIDVFEMDAATRTGIDDIREIVDSVRYAPTSARYKVYIIDEVHMLSEKAFNGLLKTLEEPPPQAKFVFATTEVRKVPVTILSRCQRFDLRRVDTERLRRHLEEIAAKEGATVEPAALALIARAAEGSVRDGISLLDQAIGLAGSEGAGAVALAQVQDMLGLADRSRVIDLYEHLMRGRLPEALELLQALYDLGSEPEVVIQDLLDVCHWLTRLKVSPSADATFSVAEEDAVRAQAMAGRLSTPVLARTWQMLLKGLDELRIAPDALRAAEMLLVRIACAADLPPPGELLQATRAKPQESAAAAAGVEPAPAAATAMAASGASRPEAFANEDAQAAAEEPAAAASPTSFEEVVRLFQTRDQPMLYSWLHERAGLVHFEPGRIELYVNGHAPADLPRRLAECLSRWTDRHWQVRLADQPGAPSLAEQSAARKQARIDALSADPRVKPILESFPGAQIVDVRAPDRQEP